MNIIFFEKMIQEDINDLRWWAYAIKIILYVVVILHMNSFSKKANKKERITL